MDVILFLICNYLYLLYTNLQPFGRYQGQASDIEFARQEIKNVKEELVRLSYFLYSPLPNHCSNFKAYPLLHCKHFSLLESDKDYLKNGEYFGIFGTLHTYQKIRSKKYTLANVQQDLLVDIRDSELKLDQSLSRFQ